MTAEPHPSTPDELTEAVLQSFAATIEPRLAELMTALVRHLHAFTREVELTPGEWEAAIRQLSETGDITDERRQEFVLWSDVLGLSTLVDALAHRPAPGATESTVRGPFYVPGAPLRPDGASLAEEDDAGIPALVHGRVLDPERRPIAGAELDVWQNGDDRLYAVQRPEAPEDHLRGRFLTRDDGGFAFRAVRPVPYPIPDDGPVGRMLQSTGRHPWRPAHIHLIVRADGFRTLTTHIFDADSDYLDSDAVFAVKPSLLRRFREREPDDPRTPPGVTGRWVSCACDLVLAPV